MIPTRLAGAVYGISLFRSYDRGEFEIGLFLFLREKNIVRLSRLASLLPYGTGFIGIVIESLAVLIKKEKEEGRQTVDG